LIGAHRSCPGGWFATARSIPGIFSWSATRVCSRGSEGRRDKIAARSPNSRAALPRPDCRPAYPGFSPSAQPGTARASCMRSNTMGTPRAISTPVPIFDKARPADPKSTISEPFCSPVGATRNVTMRRPQACPGSIGRSSTSRSWTRAVLKSIPSRAQASLYRSLHLRASRRHLISCLSGAVFAFADGHEPVVRSLELCP
jgi:hypothetical protein